MHISESCDYKTILAGILPDDDDPELLNIEIFVPLKHLSNFISNLNFLIINTEIELILKWSQNCVLTEKIFGEGKDEIPAHGGNPLVPAVTATNTPCAINTPSQIVNCMFV